MNKIKFLRDLSIRIQEKYEHSLFTKVFSGWILLTLLISLNSFLGKGYLSQNSSLSCFPHFQSCKEWFSVINLTPLPFSYLESLFFTFLFALMVLAAYYLYSKKYAYVHYLIGALFVVKLFIMSMNYGIANYDYYDIAMTFVFLLYPAGRNLLKLTFVVLYFLSSTIKIHEGWILGTYFSTLFYGLPLIPLALIPVATNIVILSQMIGCWFLLHKNEKVVTSFVYFFIAFHLYSTILVGYRYPITSLLSLLILFLVRDKMKGGAKVEKEERTFLLSKKTLPLYLFFVFLFGGQMIAIVIPGDQKLTLEGNNYGLYMFEANHQCVSRIKEESSGNASASASYDSRNRCDPYMYLISLQKKYCYDDEASTSMISWTFDHSINGEPYKRIVNTSNICTLVYKPFTHNAWIQEQGETIAKAYKNVTITGSAGGNEPVEKDGYLFASFLSNSESVTKTSFQLILERHITTLKNFYWLLWVATLLFALFTLIKNSIKI